MRIRPTVVHGAEVQAVGLRVGDDGDGGGFVSYGKAGARRCVVQGDGLRAGIVGGLVGLVERDGHGALAVLQTTVGDGDVCVFTPLDTGGSDGFIAALYVYFCQVCFVAEDDRMFRQVADVTDADDVLFRRDDKVWFEAERSNFDFFLQDGVAVVVVHHDVELLCIVRDIGAGNQFGVDFYGHGGVCTRLAVFVQGQDVRVYLLATDGDFGLFGREGGGVGAQGDAYAVACF